MSCLAGQQLWAINDFPQIPTVARSRGGVQLPMRSIQRLASKSTLHVHRGLVYNEESGRTIQVGKPTYTRLIRSGYQVPAALCATLLCFSLTPAPYEKAQASDVICKRAAHSGSGLDEKECRVLRAYKCVYACMYALLWLYTLTSRSGMASRRPCLMLMVAMLLHWPSSRAEDDFHL